MVKPYLESLGVEVHGKGVTVQPRVHTNKGNVFTAKQSLHVRKQAEHGGAQGLDESSDGEKRPRRESCVRVDNHRLHGVPNVFAVGTSRTGCSPAPSMVDGRRGRIGVTVTLSPPSSHHSKPLL